MAQLNPAEQKQIQTRSFNSLSMTVAQAKELCSKSKRPEDAAKILKSLQSLEDSRMITLNASAVAELLGERPLTGPIPKEPAKT